LGVLLIFNYCVGVSLQRVEFLREPLYGLVVRFFHVLGGRFFFLFIYIHLFRGVWFLRSVVVNIWLRGGLLLIGFIGVAFLGYVLPFGQMSFWGAMVIINFISVIPLVGGFMVEWLWGGFLVMESTVKLFLVFHVVAPMLLGVGIFVHLMGIHFYGSSDVKKGGSFKVLFYNKFILKDWQVLIFCVLFIFYCFYGAIEEDNFFIIDLVSSPLHIKPE